MKFCSFIFSYSFENNVSFKLDFKNFNFDDNVFVIFNRGPKYKQRVLGIAWLIL